MSYQAVAIGTSAGGLRALTRIVHELPPSFPVPLLVVQHVGRSADARSVELLGSRAKVKVKLGEDKERPLPGTMYLAPPDYHLLVEPEGTLALSVDEPVCHCRPSIDVLFETSADAYGRALIGVILTGANRDGASGLCAVKRRGGYAIVEDPATAEARTMPAAAIEAADVDRIAALDDIPEILCHLVGWRGAAEPGSEDHHG